MSTTATLPVTKIAPGLEKGNLCSPRAALQGVYAPDMQLTSGTLSWSNLEGADLSRLHATGLFVTEANLDSVNLEDSVLERVTFSKTTARGANLQRAWLTDCDFTNADFSGADLRGAVLTQKHPIPRHMLSHFNLSGADLRGAVLNLNTKGILVTETPITIGTNFQGAILASPDMWRPCGWDLVGVTFTRPWAEYAALAKARSLPEDKARFFYEEHPEVSPEAAVELLTQCVPS
jgi:uncharacterized protein YjbI with pentapeptide repeats